MYFSRHSRLVRQMCLALRGEGYAPDYARMGRTLDIWPDKLKLAEVQAAWFDPRTGKTIEIGRLPGKGRQSFDPPGQPGEGNDWVFVLGDAAEAPSPAKPATIHVILQVEDDGNPKLFAYRRAVITVEPGAQ